MRRNLGATFSRLAAQIPSEPTAKYSFTAARFSPLPSQLATDRLVITKGFHIYDSHYRIDYLMIYANKATYCHLGLLILNVLFKSKRPVHLELTHKASEIKRLVIGPNRTVFERQLGLHLRPKIFNYWPEEVSKNPWPNARYWHSQKLPGFFLSNKKDCVGPTEEDWQGRDTVFGFGADEGCVELAELLLNLSRPSSTTNQVALESSAGMGGVAPLSAEARLWLPGSYGWFDEYQLD